MREVRTLPEAEVIGRWAELYAAGKHKGYAPPDLGQYVGIDSTWIEVEVPHDRYSAEWNTNDDGDGHSGLGLSAAQRSRAERYAQMPGQLPPGIALFKGRRKQRRLYVSDGNHRAYAAFLRGSPTARFYVPMCDWRRFQRAAVVSERA